jgi:NmrA-like family
MQSSIKDIVLVGAGGNAGPAILTELMKSPFNVSVLSRADSKSIFPPGVKVIKSDYSHESLVAALQVSSPFCSPKHHNIELIYSTQGSDAVISLVGATNMVEVEKKLINASIDAGVSHFVPSQFGSDLDDPRCVSLVPMFEVKREILDYLREKQGSGLSWTGIYSGPFLDWVRIFLLF